MKTPTLRPDGSCPVCSGGWQCSFHQAEGLRIDRDRAQTIRRVVTSAREHDIARLCARHEIESDEMGSREDKAARRLGFHSFRDYVLQ